MKLILLAPLALAAAAAVYAQWPQAPELPARSAYTHKITFKVDAVVPATDTLQTESYKEVVHNTFVRDVLESETYAHENQAGYVAPRRAVESFSRDRRPLTGVQTNGFFETAHTAYAQHRPLVLSPDMVWLVIAQGFALHINQNSEALRAHFVRHQGKKVLEVEMTGKIQLGNDDSDWEWAFRQFHDSIAANTSPDLAALVAGRFSGTNTDAAVAFDITLMDAMKSYFDFWGRIACGIPEITLEGTPEDWKQIEQRATQLSRYDLDWWLADLKPILAEFTKTAGGKPDREFWAGMFKDVREAVCGGDTYVTGWITRLFPYIKEGEEYRRNPLIGLKAEDLYTSVQQKKVKQNVLIDGELVSTELLQPESNYWLCAGDTSYPVVYTGPKVTTDNIPPGISTAILNIDNNGDYHKMELKAGFFGMRQDAATNALRPVIGWAVIETGERPEPDVLKRYEDHKKAVPAPVEQQARTGANN